MKYALEFKLDRVDKYKKGQGSTSSLSMDQHAHMYYSMLYRLKEKKKTKATENNPNPNLSEKQMSYETANSSDLTRSLPSHDLWQS